MRLDDKIKSPTKDTHGLRLNLKVPESRRHYPPDDNDLNAIHVISSEYEVVSNTQAATMHTPPAPPPPPPPPPFPSHMLKPSSSKVQVIDETFLPKIKNKYGAVSKNYMKKLSSIFHQHPVSAKIVFDDSRFAETNNNDKVINDNFENFQIKTNGVDEKRENFSDQSISNLKNIVDNVDDDVCDSCKTKSSNNNQNNLKVNNDENNSRKNLIDEINMRHRVLNKKLNNDQTNNKQKEAIGGFSLPRITLNKPG